MYGGWLLAGCAWLGCARSDARGAMLRGPRPSLAVCLPGQAARTVGDLLPLAWAPGDRMTVRGYLAAVAYGPPCEGAQPPGSGRHCGVAWTLSEVSSRPLAYDDSLPGDLMQLTSGPLPILNDDRDAVAARATAGDLD